MTPSACILRRAYPSRETWCGRTTPENEHLFEDREHALLYDARGKRDWRLLRVCEKCADAVGKKHKSESAA